MEEWITASNFTPALKIAYEIAIFSKATQCYICHSKFSSKEGYKNVDHYHISGRYSGALYRKCNIKLSESFQSDDI